MDFNSLLSGVLSNGVYRFLELLLIAGVGMLIAVLKKRAVSWADPVRAGLSAAGWCAVLFISVNIIIALPRWQVETTTSNVKQRLRQYLDDFHLSVKDDADQESYFSLDVTLPQNQGRDHIVISRPKSLDRYIVLSCGLIQSPEDAVVFSKLSQGQLDEMRSNVVIEGARSNVNYQFIPKPFTLFVVKRIPITRALTEDVLLESMDQMTRAMTLFRGVTARTITQGAHHR